MGRADESCLDRISVTLEHNLRIKRQMHGNRFGNNP
jgi:hypothetical protein